MGWGGLKYGENEIPYRGTRSGVIGIPKTPLYSYKYEEYNEGL